MQSFLVRVAQFLSDLFETGRVSVFIDLPAEIEEDVDEVLVSAEKVAATNLAGTSPDFDLACARWAARIFYGACHFLVCRDVNPETIEAFFKQPSPAPHSPQTDYSVDLVFRYLPDLVGMTRAVASGDPLLQQLLKLGQEWPLSSVGIHGIDAVDSSAFIAHRGLRQLYVDRIVARADVSRLGNPQLDLAVRESLGDYPALSESIAKHLKLSPVVSVA
jgi:MoxR-vWA-beta-propeller ternary system domain bpX4